MSIRWAEVWADAKWLAGVGAVLLTLAAAGGCSRGGGGVSGPSEIQTNAQAPVTAPLAAPARLRAVWATADRALGRVGAFQANAVVLQIETWGDDYTGLAARLRERGVGAMVYVKQCFTAPRSTWDACWARVEVLSKPLRDAGVLWGYHVMDEPALRGNYHTGLSRDANAYVRGRGFDVLATEWVEYVSDQKMYRFPRPAGVRWYGVTCYGYGGTPSKPPTWRASNCFEEYARHPDWDTMVIPASPDVCEGHKCDVGAWEAQAARLGRGVAFWVTD